MRLLFLGWLLCSLGCHPPAAAPDAPQEWSADSATTEKTPPEVAGGQVGAVCQADGDCHHALVCEDRIPQGYCTKTCTSTTQCPKQSACVKIKFPDGTAFLRCLRTCLTNDDCRSDFYCYHPPGAWKLICLPTAAKPSP